MTLQKPVVGQGSEISPPLAQRDPMLTAVGTIQHQLDEQTRLLQSLQHEIITLRETQSTYHETLTKLERQLRWTRWVRRVRGTIAALFWLGAAAVIVYYWHDLSTLWNDWSRFIL